MSTACLVDRSNTIGQALAEPQPHARGMIVETQSPVWGTVRSPASPVRAGPQRAEHDAAPARGQHTEELCEQLLGYDRETFRELARAGAFGPDPGA